VSLIPATLLPAALHMAGLVYFAWALLLGIAFASLSVTCARTRSRSDARRLFLASILYLPLLLAVLMIDKL
jgi:protoheme IX farnesyltransferase